MLEELKSHKDTVSVAAGVAAGAKATISDSGMLKVLVDIIKAITTTNNAVVATNSMIARANDNLGSAISAIIEQLRK